jgi:hypothetical protein
MKNVEFLSITHQVGIEEIAVIYNEDGSYTSMPKAVYEAQQAEQSTPNLAD